MKRIIFFLSFYFHFMIAFDGLDTQYASEQDLKEKLDTEIERLQQEIRSYGYEPQDKILKQQENLKQKDFYLKNGFFLGISIGMGTIYNAYDDGKYNRKNNVEGASNTGVLLQNFDTSATEFLFGGKIGYQNFFSEYFGTRIYGDALLGSGTIKYHSNSIGKNTYMLGALNFDFLGEYPIGKKFDVGVFLGFGFGIMLMSEEGKNINELLLDKNFVSENILWKNFLQIDYAFNIGCNVSYLKKHRFEFGLKVPVSFLRLGLEKTATYSNGSEEKELMSQDIDFKRSSFFTLGYIYVF